jgi:predicted transposase YbfD/YdcC
VSAWVSDAKILFGQVRSDDKSNEITAIPELLKLLEIEAALVTIDAMGTQTEIARQIVEVKKADYLLALRACFEKRIKRNKIGEWTIENRIQAI